MRALASAAATRGGSVTISGGKVIAIGSDGGAGIGGGNGRARRHGPSPAARCGKWAMVVRTSGGRQPYGLARTPSPAARYILRVTTLPRSQQHHGARLVRTVAGITPCGGRRDWARYATASTTSSPTTAASSTSGCPTATMISRWAKRNTRQIADADTTAIRSRLRPQTPTSPSIARTFTITPPTNS